jgi:hypothetical protein
MQLKFILDRRDITDVDTKYNKTVIMVRLITSQHSGKLIFWYKKINVLY